MQNYDWYYLQYVTLVSCTLQLRKINTLEIALQLLSLEYNTTNIMIWPEQKACPHFLDGCNLVHYRSIYYRSSGEKLIRYQANTSCVIMFVILMTTVSYKSLLLQGEIWCWSLLGFKGLSGGCISLQFLHPNFLQQILQYYFAKLEGGYIYSNTTCNRLG